MIDFNKLKVPTAEELKQADERRRQAEIAEDQAKRQERSRRTITITLTCDAESRYTMGGTKIISLRGKQPGGKPVHAIWYAPDHMDDGEFSDIYNRCLEGSISRLDGYWKPHKNSSGETCFTFTAQFIQFEDGPRVP